MGSDIYEHLSDLSEKADRTNELLNEIKEELTSIRENTTRDED